MAAQLQIVLPGLFDLPQAEFEPGFLRQRLPLLNRLLRLASRRPNKAYSVDAILRAALGIEGGEDAGGASLPLAGAQADDARGARSMLCQAIHLRPDLQQALVLPIEKDAETLAEVALLLGDLARVFEADCELSELSGGVYLMRLKAFDAPRHYPHPLSALGKVVNPYIEQARSMLPWYRLLNEMQMFLHQHEVNRRRVERACLPINSLWFWGAGEIPPPLATGPGWYCDDPLLNRFAAQVGLEAAPLAAFADAPAHAIAVDLRLLETLKTGGEGDLQALLLDLERDLIAPAMAAARRGRTGVRLRAGYACDFEAGALSGLRFWRRRVSLANWRADDPAT